MSQTPSPIDLPDPGATRYWEIKHQPNKKTTPLRIELREHTKRDSQRHVQGWTRLLGFEETIALPDSIAEAATKVLERASRVDEFVGMHMNRRIEENA